MSRRSVQRALLMFDVAAYIGVLMLYGWYSHSKFSVAWQIALYIQRSGGDNLFDVSVR